MKDLGKENYDTCLEYCDREKNQLKDVEAIAHVLARRELKKILSMEVPKQNNKGAHNIHLINILL